VIPHDGATASRRRAGGSDRDEALVARLHTMAPALDGEPDPAFRAATRARLVAMAAVRTPAPEPVSRLRGLLSARAGDAAPVRRRARLTAGLAGSALTVTALAVVVALASGAHPGDVLYGLKRGTEQTQLALAGDSRGTTLLDFAGTRLQELRTLVGDDAGALPVAGATTGTGGTDLLAAGAAPELVLQTLHVMDAQTTEGASWLDRRAVSTRDAGPLDELSSWAAGQSAGLAALRPDMPPAATSAFQASLDLLSGIGTRTVALRASLACASGPATAGTDALGPVPARCVARPAPPAAGTSGSPTAPPPGPPTGAGSTSASTPASGGGAGTGQNGSGTTGGAVPPPTAPAPTLPSTGGLVPTVPSLPLPSVTVPTLPGTTTSTPSSGGGLCLPPVLTVGNC
jgi:hypothetical protein